MFEETVSGNMFKDTLVRKTLKEKCGRKISQEALLRNNF